MDENIAKQIHSLANRLNQIRVPNLFNISDPALDAIRAEKTEIAKELFRLAKNGR